MKHKSMDLQRLNNGSMPEQNSFVPILVYGATLAGIGIADSSSQNALLVEPSVLVGSEFIASFNPGECWEKTPVSQAAKKLREELKKRNLLSEEDRVHLPPIAPVLFNLIRTQNLKVQMMTKIIEVQPSAHGYNVTLYNASGLHKVEVGRIIDTTSTCASCSSYEVDIQYRKLNAMLHCAQPLSPEFEDETINLVYGMLPGELILKFKLGVNDSWIEARDKLHHYWMNRPGVLQPWTLATVADTFEVGAAKGPHLVANDWLWLPSCAYSNLLGAFDAGQLFIGGEVNETIAAR